jgi:hypothetical protein
MVGVTRPAGANQGRRKISIRERRPGFTRGRVEKFLSG